MTPDLLIATNGFTGTWPSIEYGIWLASNINAKITLLGVNEKLNPAAIDDHNPLEDVFERAIEQFSPEDNPLKLQFVAHKYGPYANKLDHLLNNLDGSYLHCDKRISDAGPLDIIWFDDERLLILSLTLLQVK